jgi:hypothetical protein
MEHTIPSYYVVLENVFGVIGTVLWSFQLAPQGKTNRFDRSIILSFFTKKIFASNNHVIQHIKIGEQNLQRVRLKIYHKNLLFLPELIIISLQDLPKQCFFYGYVFIFKYFF